MTAQIGAEGVGALSAVTKRFQKTRRRQLNDQCTATAPATFAETAAGWQNTSEDTDPQHLTPSTQEAEDCFWKAIEIARKQQAKSLELRAVMSLARLWQQQGKQHEAHEMLSEIYGWFTEGFTAVDLHVAKLLLDSLALPLPDQERRTPRS